MNKFNFKALAFALALIMVISAFMTACTSGGGIETESATGSTESESQKNENNTEKNPGDSENETTEKSEETDPEEVVLPVKGDFAASIVEADRLQDVDAEKNGRRHNEPILLHITGLKAAHDGAGNAGVNQVADRDDQSTDHIQGEERNMRLIILNKSFNHTL